MTASLETGWPALHSIVALFPKRDQKLTQRLRKMNESSEMAKVIGKQYAKYKQGKGLKPEESNPHSKAI